jgi:hypothetical protein
MSSTRKTVLTLVLSFEKPLADENGILTFYRVKKKELEKNANAFVLESVG